MNTRRPTGEGEDEPRSYGYSPGTMYPWLMKLFLLFALMATLAATAGAINGVPDAASEVGIGGEDDRNLDRLFRVVLALVALRMIHLVYVLGRGSFEIHVADGEVRAVGLFTSRTFDAAEVARIDTRATPWAPIRVELRDGSTVKVDDEKGPSSGPARARRVRRQHRTRPTTATPAKATRGLLRAVGDLPPARCHTR